MTITKASFFDLREFLLSWGLCPHKDVRMSGGMLGNADGYCSINHHCYVRMCEEAEKEYGKDFRSLLSRMIGAVDGEYYLNADGWKDLQKDWEEAL